MRIPFLTPEASLLIKIDDALKALKDLTTEQERPEIARALIEARTGLMATQKKYHLLFQKNDIDILRQTYRALLLKLDSTQQLLTQTTHTITSLLGEIKPGETREAFLQNFLNKHLASDEEKSDTASEASERQTQKATANNNSNEDDNGDNDNEEYLQKQQNLLHSLATIHSAFNQFDENSDAIETLRRRFNTLIRAHNTSSKEARDTEIETIINALVLKIHQIQDAYKKTHNVFEIDTLLDEIKNGPLEINEKVNQLNETEANLLTLFQQIAPEELQDDDEEESESASSKNYASNASSFFRSSSRSSSAENDDEFEESSESEKEDEKKPTHKKSRME